jgi:methylmalonyl-CoA mutase N-terminal domain/subunit
MPHLIEAVKACATLGEICGAMRDVFGTYEEIAIT